MAVINEAWEALLSLFFPPRCPHCAAYVETRGDWCGACLEEASDVRLVTPPAGLDAVWALGHYREGLRGLIRALKFQKKKSELPYIHTFIESSGSFLPELKRLADIAVPIPLHAAREKARGFNQAELIFAPYLASQGLPLRRCLTRTKNTRPMYGLKRAERMENAAGAFAASEEVRGHEILLVDDIMTTGSTLAACAGALRAAGARGVSALILATDHMEEARIERAGGA